MGLAPMRQTQAPARAIYAIYLFMANRDAGQIRSTRFSLCVYLVVRCVRV
jgi:hypothetical protein